MKKKALVILAIFIITTLHFSSISQNFVQDFRKEKIENQENLDSSDEWVLSRVLIDEKDPNLTWNKRATEKDWCSGSGTWDDPYILENITINFNKIDGGLIEIRNSNVFFIIRNCTLYKTDLFGNGIKLENTSNGFIINNYCSNENGDGIQLDDSNNNTIMGNTLENNMANGIELDNSENNRIIQNSIIANNYGIEMMYICRNTIISENYLKGNGRGMYLEDILEANITQNTLISNPGGIYLYSSDYNIISKNEINKSSNRGIFLDAGSFDNLLSGNFLNENDINGRDNGQRNLWNNSVIGNYWSDYTGRDADDDGIGDTPYVVPGSAYPTNSIDYLPIWDDNIESSPYFVNKSSDFSMVQGDSTKSITWIPKDINRNYNYSWILRNDTLVYNATWDGSHIIYTELDSLEPSIYNFTCFVNDTDGFRASASVIVVVLKDIFNPEIEILYPFPDQLFGNKTIRYELSIFEPNLNTTWYSLNGGKNHTFTGTIGTINQEAWDLCGNGTVNINFYANDSYNNLGFKQIIVRKDTHYPVIAIISPLPSQLYGHNAPRYELLVDEPKVNYIWYSLNGGLNYTISNTIGTINQDAWDTCGNGTVIIAFYINNTAGNLGSSKVMVRKDIFNPLISVISPTYNYLFGKKAPNFNITVEDQHLDTTWYSLNGGLKIIFTGITGKINQSAWDSCENGTVTIGFYANDTVGNIGYDQVIVRKDNISPNITILSPQPYEVFGNTTFNFELIIREPHLNSNWYSVNENSNYTFTGLTGTINQDAWDECENGTVLITFYSNDSLGNIGSKQIIIYKDIISPDITILSPKPYEVFGNTTFNFELIILEPHLNSTWYSVNGSSNYMFEGLHGVIDQAAWDLSGNGPVTITFYANDSLGNIGFSEIIIYKDILIPIIIIHSPVSNQSCGPLSPFFNVTIIGPDIHTRGYSINGTSLHEFLGTNGRINQETWDLFGSGYISIIFFANNSLGNYFLCEVIVVKQLYLHPRNAYAIVIGISNYPGSANDLNYCDDDALAVRNMLVNEYNFEPENIIYLEDSNATKNEISNAFDLIASQISPNDIFYFYYSGHGGADILTSSPSTLYVQSPHPYPDYYDYTWWVSSTDAAYIRVHFELFDLQTGSDYLYIGDTWITEGYYYQELTGQGTDFWSDWIPVQNDNRIYLRMITDSSNDDYYWGFRVDQIQVKRYSNPHYLCPYDSIPNNPGKYYLDSLLNTKLDSLDCENKYVVIDACNSGGLFPELEDTNHFLMSACKSGQFSMEDEALGHGVFTNYLIESFNNANDQNSDGVISMEECFSYVSSNTKAYSASYGPGLQFNPQKFDGINGEAVLYPSIGSISINPVDNQLFYSFYLYGHGYLKTLNITVCSISPVITFKTEEIKNLIISPTGFGYYSGLIMLEESYIAGGIQLLAEIEGNRLITIDLVIGDSDGDGLTDMFEILNGLDPSLNDTDFDGLLDGEEVNIYNTDPLNSDSDFDGLLDGEEVNIYSTDPLNGDTDSDGLLDGEEVNVYNTDPLSEDTDLDSMPDGWEVINLLDPLFNDAGLDPDYDLLTNILEYQSDTDPQNPDSDADGLLDGEEVNVYSTNPLVEDTDSDGLLDGEEVNTYGTDPLNIDTDSDGLLDGEEVNVYGTDPLSGDTDFDTMPDKWEIDNLLNPLINDSAQDPDNDLLTNILEYQYNTDPQDPDSDGDGWSDGDEVLVYNTDPLDPTDQPNPRSTKTIPTYNISLILGLIGAISGILIKKITGRKRRIKSS